MKMVLVRFAQCTHRPMRKRLNVKKLWALPKTFVEIDRLSQKTVTNVTTASHSQELKEVVKFVQLIDALEVLSSLMELVTTVHLALVQMTGEETVLLQKRPSQLTLEPLPTHLLILFKWSQPNQIPLDRSS